MGSNSAVNRNKQSREASHEKTMLSFGIKLPQPWDSSKHGRGGPVEFFSQTQGSNCQWMD